MGSGLTNYMTDEEKWKRFVENLNRPHVRFDID
jgi:hypothetical protein